MRVKTGTVRDQNLGGRLESNKSLFIVLDISVEALKSLLNIVRVQTPETAVKVEAENVN